MILNRFLIDVLLKPRWGYLLFFSIEDQVGHLSGSLFLIWLPSSFYQSIVLLNFLSVA
jgi:hypothetical protein